MLLRDKVVNNSRITWRMAVVAVFVLVLSVQFVFGAVYAMSKQVSIVDGDKTYTVSTSANNIAEVLAKEGIMLSEADEISPALDQEVLDNAVIHISRAKNAANGSGETFDKLTANIANAGFGLRFGEGAKLNGGSFNTAPAGIMLGSNVPTETIITEERTVPFNRVKRATTDLPEGQHQIAQSGVDGIIEDSYKVSYWQGQEISRELVASEKISDPVDQIVEYGAGTTVAYRSGSLISRGEELRYKQVITMEATAYDLSFSSCGKYPGDPAYGITASGMRARRGVVAVDPRVIPLGTRLYIEAPDGSWSYGTAVAGDTGGAIKGNRIDLFMDSYQECINFGRRSAVVYVLE